MKKLLIIGLALMATACASNSDLAKLQSEVDVLQTKVNTIATDADQAKTFANLAAEKSTFAEAAAQKALRLCQDIDAKLDRMFKKAQYK